MKYIRTKNGIYEVKYDEEGRIVVPTNIPYIKSFGTKKDFKDNGCKFADTIEELMMIGDLVFKKNGDIFVIQNQAYIDYYIKHKSVEKLFFKDSKGNYIKVAETNNKGELELL